MEIKIKWIPRKQMTHENTYRDDNYAVFEILQQPGEVVTTSTMRSML